MKVKFEDLIASTTYEFVSDFYKGIARAKKNGRWGILNNEGEEIVPFEYEDIVSLSFSGGLIGIKKNGKWGFINRNGETVIPIKYDAVFPFYGKFGVTKVMLDNKWGIINKEGDEVTKISYSKVELFGRGIALSEEDGKLDYISYEHSLKNFRNTKE